MLYIDSESKQILNGHQIDKSEKTISIEYLDGLDVKVVATGETFISSGFYESIQGLDVDEQEEEIIRYYFYCNDVRTVNPLNDGCTILSNATSKSKLILKRIAFHDLIQELFYKRCVGKMSPEIKKIIINCGLSGLAFKIEKDTAFFSYLPEDKYGYNALVKMFIERYINGSEIVFPDNVEDFRKKYSGNFSDTCESYLTRKLGYLKLKVDDIMIYLEDGEFAKEYLEKIDNPNKGKKRVRRK